MDFKILNPATPDFNNDKDVFTRQTKDFLYTFYNFLDSIHSNHIPTVHILLGESILNDLLDDVVYSAFKSKNRQLLSKLDDLFTFIIKYKQN